jgi:hypothetical protein
MDTPAGLELANESVVLEGVNQEFLDFVSHVGVVHALIFGHPLVITSGRDSHAPGDVHMRGDAVDLRTVDKDPEGVMLLLAMLAYAATTVAVAVFDERQGAGGPHIHIEWRGA